MSNIVRNSTRRLALLAALALWSGGAALADDPVYTSTKAQGSITIAPDPTLADGRFVLKVVAFNLTQQPAAFASESVQIFTASGQPVAILSLDTLIEETRASAAGTKHSMDSSYQSSNYGRPGTRRTETGEVDVSGYAGANDAVGRDMATRAATRPRKGEDSKEVKAQIENLQAAILQRHVIGRATAAGGQLVTEPLKFAAGEPHKVRVVVDFNDEQHQLDFDAPH